MNKRIIGSIFGKRSISYFSILKGTAGRNRQVFLCGLTVLLVHFLALNVYAGKSEGPEGASSKDEVTEILQYDFSNLSALSVEKLEDLLREVEAAIPQAGLTAQKIQKDLYDARTDARTHPSVLELRSKIDELKKKIEETINNLPEVKAKADASMAKKQEMLELMQLRTKLLGILSQKERSAKGAVSVKVDS